MKQGFRRMAAAVMTVTVLTSAVNFPASAENSYTPISYYFSDSEMKEVSVSTNQVPYVWAHLASKGNSSWRYMYNKDLNIKITDYCFMSAGKKTQNYPVTNKMYAFMEDDPSYQLEQEDYVRFMANLETVYRYFKDLGFTYSGSDTSNFIDYTATGSKNDKTIYASFAHSGDNQADATSDYGMMVFGSGHQYLNPLYLDKECVAHEFAHLVSQEYAGWHGTDMSMYYAVGGLAEAYSDILAELMSDYPDWKVGTGAYTDNVSKKYSFRDIANPGATVSHAADGSDVYKDYYSEYYEWAKLPGYADRYAVSTIYSHAAYLMYRSGIPAKDLRNIWFNSLKEYPEASKINHVSCRIAVLAAANKYLPGKYSSSTVTRYLRLIRQAFDTVGIKSRSSTYQYSAVSSTNMSDFMRAMAYKYPSGNYWTTGDVDRSTGTRPAANWNQTTFMPEGPSVGLNYSDTNWKNDGEPYYQCAGFAKKLQVEYFGTGLFTQLDDALGYQPQLGDHIRLERVRSPYQGHSIFVTGFSGNTVYYAECEGGNYSKISLNKKGYVSKDYQSGKCTFTLDGVSYYFVWVQRPIPVGDMNADSVVNYADLSALYDYLDHSATSACSDNIRYQYMAADINEDGKVNSTDYSLLSEMLRSNAVRLSYGYID